MTRVVMETNADEDSKAQSPKAQASFLMDAAGDGDSKAEASAGDWPSVEERQRMELLAQAEARRRAREQERLKIMEQERQRQEEQAWLEERARMEASLRVVQRREEDHWCQQNGVTKHEEDKAVRKDALELYCKRHGFAGINEPRKSGCVVWRAGATYAIHTAAEQGDSRIMGMLLKEGACLTVRDSSGLTAAQIATKFNRRGSHDAVLRLLRAEQEASRETVGGRGGA